jgi:hypothetical protein
MESKKEFDSLKDKLKKLKALAERGCGGEKENAQRLLERLCAANGIDLGLLNNEEKKSCYTFNIGRNRVFLTLFTQCYCKVTDSSKMSYRQESRSEISLELTQVDYAELKGLYEWHKANFEKELEDIKKTIIHAYCQKHRLYPGSPSETSNDKPLTEEDLEMLRKVMKMEGLLNDKTYQHLIEE